MGGAISVNFIGKVEDKDVDINNRDRRRRNSLAFYISQFLEYEEEDYAPLIEEVKQDKLKNGPKGINNIKASKFNRIAETILQGNMKELRNQVVVNFVHINRKYKDQHVGYSLIHMICQEGYYTMLTFMEDPANHSELDKNDLEISPKNDRQRTPLMLCFTPPTATYLGLKFGVNSDGTVKSEKPDDIPVTDWIQPGGPKSRENCIRFLVENGADVNEKDFHNYIPLHYATMWGWTSTVRYLLQKGADVNATTVAGKTPLMLAVDYHHLQLVNTLCLDAKININMVDADGFTALTLAVQQGDDGMEIFQRLLIAGADPNIVTLRKKTCLKFACESQNLTLVNLLMDHKVERRPSAMNLLNEEHLNKIQARLKEEERKVKEEEQRLETEMMEKEKLGFIEATKNGKKSPWGAWVEYRDKRNGQPFYYNPVSRKCQREKPKDFKPNKKRVITEAIFGLNFYH